MEKIWIIAHCYRSESDYNWNDLIEDIDPDYGFFTSESDAQAFCATINPGRDQYDLVVRRLNADNNNAANLKEQRERQNRVLRNAGLPEMPSSSNWSSGVKPIPTFEKWVSDQSHYAPVEVSAYKA